MHRRCGCDGSYATLGSFFFAAYKEHTMGIDEGLEWMKGKIERDWKKMSAQGQKALGNGMRRYWRHLEPNNDSDRIF